MVATSHNTNFVFIIMALICHINMTVFCHTTLKFICFNWNEWYGSFEMNGVCFLNNITIFRCFSADSECIVAFLLLKVPAFHIDFFFLWRNCFFFHSRSPHCVRLFNYLYASNDTMDWTGPHYLKLYSIFIFYIFKCPTTSIGVKLPFRSAYRLMWLIWLVTGFGFGDDSTLTSSTAFRARSFLAKL